MSANLAPSDLRPLALDPGQDLLGGLLKYDLWGRLGWLEVKRRYRRTLIGPFWSSISLLVFVVGIGAVGSGLLSKQVHDYMPYLASGMAVWLMISTMLNEAGSIFVAGSGLLRQKQFEYSILVYALVWRNVLVFAHNMLVYAVIVLIQSPGLITFKILVYGVPGMALVLINGAWMTMLLGIVTLRFRDIQQIVQSLLQIAIFTTPIFWLPDSLGGMRRIIFVALNPLHHLLEIVRSPLLGMTPRLNSYIAVALITVVGWTITFAIFRKFRKRIPYWI